MIYFTGDFQSDCYILFQYIDELPLFTTNNRKKYNNNVRPISNVYGTTCFSKVQNRFGTTEKIKNPDADNYFTKLRGDFPEYQEIFEEFMQEYTEFDFNQVVINRDFKITKHLDASNVGESMIIGLGDYDGGELNIERKGGIDKVDIKHKFYKFNGSEEPHWVSDFKGRRYSLVFYSIKN